MSLPSGLRGTKFFERGVAAVGVDAAVRLDAEAVLEGVPLPLLVGLVGGPGVDGVPLLLPAVDDPERLAPEAGQVDGQFQTFLAVTVVVVERPLPLREAAAGPHALAVRPE